MTLLIFGLPGLISAQTLTHRYSFITNLNDSVGGAAWAGTFVTPSNGTPATVSNGLSLAGATAGNVSGYVTLPTGIVLGDTNVSVECWVQPTAVNTWAEIWAFGVNGGAAVTNFALIQDSPGPGNMRVAFTPNGNETDIMAPTYMQANGATNYTVVTYNNTNITANLFLNGALDGTVVFSTARSYSPGTFGGATGTTSNTLGNDRYGDPQFGGNIYELRIWNGVLSQRYISASTIVGPSVLVTNLTPTNAIFGAVVTNMVATGTQPGNVFVQIAATGTNQLLASMDVTNWSSANTNVLTVNSNGLITGVGAGTTTVKATIAGVSCTSSSITVTPQLLTHRYSFVSDLTDSVGGTAWTGSFVAGTNGTTPTASNGLALPGNTKGGFGSSGYVSLPSGILLSNTSLTVECWVQPNSVNTWAEIWDFGVNGTTNFALIQDNSPTGTMRVGFTPNGGEDDITAPSFLPATSNYVAVTYNDSTLLGSLYTNGALIASTTLPRITFSQGNCSYDPGTFGAANGVGTTQDMLGNDVFGDQQFGGTIYELRIWNGALSPIYVALAAAVGPSVIVTNTTPLSFTNSVTTTMIGAQTQQAVILGNFAVATNINVTDAATSWSSSNTNILTVNATGLITAVSGGSATVTAVIGASNLTSALITVALTKPAITQQPASVNGVVGETVTFTVTAIGGNLGYQWNAGSTPIGGATNATLTLTNLSFNQAGSYSVLVTNSLGSVTSAIVTLTVNSSLLAHRYSFVSDASDSVGGPSWNGTIVAPTTGAPATIANGLSLPGNAGGGNGVSGYVSLPNGIVAGDTSVTVECWVQPNLVNTWAEIWDFGSSGSINFALIQDSPGSGGQMRVAFTPNGGENDIDAVSGDLSAGSESYVAVTYNNSNLTGNLYLNGVLDGSTVLPNATYSPGSFGGAGGTTANTFGNDVFGDPQFSGTIYEVRIWNGVVSQTYISASEALGPGTVVTNLTPTSVTVTAPGTVTMTGTIQAAVNVTIAAAGSTSLLATSDATNWVSGNTNVLTVNSSGLITGVGPGTTTISATVNGLTGTSSSITVSSFSLINRYSFVSDATDSIGGMNGTLIPGSAGAAATISNGLFLPGNTKGGSGYSGYLSLPSSILVGTSSLTVECWMLQSNANVWAEVWDFGNNGNQNFALIAYPNRDNNDLEVAFTPNGAELDLVTANHFPTNAEEYVCLTYNNYTLTGSLYTNGVLDAARNFPSTFYAPGSIGGSGGTDQNMLGNDVYGDDQFSGAIYEFRIWNGAVSPLYIAVSAAAGSSVVVTNLTPSSVSIGLAVSNMLAGQSQQASVVGTFTTATNVPVTDAATNWSSSNTNILTVNSSGLITAVAGGSATVSATVGGVTATSASITIPVTMGITSSGNNIVLTWSAGTLVQATNLLGPWTTNTAVSPYSVKATNAAEYYKIRVH